MTNADLELLRDFIKDPDNYSHIYGGATVTEIVEGKTRPIGTLIINNKGDKPIDYFLADSKIDGRDISVFNSIILTKKDKVTGRTTCLVLPPNKNL